MRSYTLSYHKEEGADNYNMARIFYQKLSANWFSSRYESPISTRQTNKKRKVAKQSKKITYRSLTRQNRRNSHHYSHTEETKRCTRHFDSETYRPCTGRFLGGKKRNSSTTMSRAVSTRKQLRTSL